MPVIASRRLQAAIESRGAAAAKGAEGAVDGAVATGGGEAGADRPLGSGNFRQVRVRGCQPRRDRRGGGYDGGGVVLSFPVQEDLARHIIAEQHRISISAVQVIAAREVSAIEQIVTLCHEMARQIVRDPMVRAGIRITFEFSADDRGPAGP